MVLGFAALAATISQAPRRESKSPTAASAPLPRASVGGPGQVRLRGTGRPKTVRLRAGASTTLVVSVPEPGQVELENLDLVAPAEPSTPATFPLSVEPGRYRVVFTPAGSADERLLGTLLARR
jgi:hypothetical protein